MQNANATFSTTKKTMFFLCFQISMSNEKHFSCDYYLKSVYSSLSFWFLNNEIFHYSFIFFVLSSHGLHCNICHHLTCHVSSHVSLVSQSVGHRFSFSSVLCCVCVVLKTDVSLSCA